MWQPFTPPKKPWPFCHFHTDDYSHSCVSSFDTDKKSLNVQVKRQQCIHIQAELSWPFCHSRLIPSIGIQTPSGGKCELRCHGQPVTSILSPSQASDLTRETNNTQWQIYRLRPSGLPAIKPPQVHIARQPPDIASQHGDGQQVDTVSQQVETRLVNSQVGD